jgi:endonuclease YncB( thermonuclease family)
MLRLVLTLALILPISVALVLLTFALAHAEVSGPALVIDGDTIEISGERIRLHGIDTPEANQTCLNDFGKRWQCGQEATLALKALIRDHSITCKGAERDKYRRLIAVCFAGLNDLNAEMVRQGWALAYRKYSTDYVAD